jgi:hypothetical protein
MHLTTQFYAEVDGTDGDTRLATARGAIPGKAGTKGKTTSLDVTVSQGRLEDMLRLGVKSDQALINGAIAFQTSCLFPRAIRT